MNWRRMPRSESRFQSLADAAAGRGQPADSQHGHGGRRPVPAAALLVFPQGFGLLAMQDGKPLVPDGENKYHAILGNSGPAYFVSASSFGPGPDCARRDHETGVRIRHPGSGGGEFLRYAAERFRREIALMPERDADGIIVPLSATRNATYEVRQKEAMDWPLAAASRRAQNERQLRFQRKGGSGSCGSDTLGPHQGRRGAGRESHQRRDGRSRPPKRPRRRDAAEPERVTKYSWRALRLNGLCSRPAAEGIIIGKARTDCSRTEPLRHAALEGHVHRRRVGSHGPARQRPLFWCQHT